MRARTSINFLNGSLHRSDALRLFFNTLHDAADREADLDDYHASVAKLLGVRHVYAVGAGRMGLYLLLKALNYEPGSEVLLPGYTCVVMPNAIRFANLTPVYADIQLSDLNMDPAAVEAAITPRTRAVLMQHTFGIPADIEQIQSICKRHQLFLIEDGAHSLGAQYKGKFTGKWGDAAIFSSESSKMITTDKGGLLVTDDDTLAEKIRPLYAQMPIRPANVEKLAALRIVHSLIVHNATLMPGSTWGSWYAGYMVRWVARTFFNPPGGKFPLFDAEEYEAELDGVQFEGYPRRLSGILSKAGKWQIDRLVQDVQMRNLKAAYLTQCLPAKGARVLTYNPELSIPSFVKFPFLVDDRQLWQQALDSIGLPTSTWLNDPLHPKETRCHLENNYEWGSCPNAEYASEHVLNLPVNRTVSMADLRKIETLSF